MYGLFLVEMQKTNLINAGDLAVLAILTARSSFFQRPPYAAQEY